jgi:PAS domain S-box-containing protein
MRMADAQNAVRARAFEEMSDAVLIADDARHYVDVNDAACAMLGRTRDELLRLRVDDVFPSPNGIDVDDAWRRFLAEGWQHGELTIESGGASVVVEYRARARIAPNRHMSVLRDVTARVRATRAAERRERAFRQLADHLPHVVARFDREHRHLYVNKAIAKVTGESPDAMVGKTNADLGRSDEDVRTWDTLIDRAFAGEEVTADFSFGEPNARRTFLTHVVPERDPSGAIETVLSVTLDVTEEREALSRRERHARDAEQARAILDALLMTAPVGFGFLDRELRFQLINPALAAINGLSIEAHIGRTPMEVLPGLAADFVRTHAEAVFRTGEPQTNLELVGETPAQPGVMRTWIEHWYPVRVDGHVIGVGIVVEEVTEKRAADARLREAGELRDRLMAIVSHDLRNPLNAIVTAASIITLDGEGTRQINAMVGKILASSKRMNRLIEQLLDFVRVDQAGGLRLEAGPMEMRSAVERAVDECQLAFPDAAVDVEIRGSTAGDWDEDRILQVMANLLSNALQHGEGRARVLVDGSSRDVVRVEVANGGRPIPAEMLPIIFDPFRRANEGLTRRGGLGLGLYISRSIVETHDGTIDVRSDEQGTVFTVTLPRR